MITFTKFGKYGRLGNQLFQLAAMVGIAKKHNHKLILPKWNYSKYFNYTIEEGYISSQSEIKEPHFHYSDNLKIGEKGIYDLLGYFQSPKYWENAIEEVKNQLTFKEEFIASVRNKYAAALNNNPLAISIRRGDYVNNPNYHLLPITYYLTSLFEYFPDWRKRNIIIFSDDVDYCKAHFGCYENIYYAENSFNNNDKRLYFSENKSAIEQLALMSLCNDFIISNSTFSYWGAYLGEKENTKVIYPHIYAKGNLEKEINFKDHYPDNWIKNEFTNKRISLKDVTFTIPVHYDHSDRFENLALNVCMLYNSFDTNVIIGEQGSQRFGEFVKWCDYLEFKDKEFHRTRMLNVMAKMATTEIIVNYDADVFIPPLQIIKSIDELKQNDFVFPYDGRFARVSRSKFRELSDFLDVGILSSTKWPGTNEKDIPSVGGCLFWNKKAFFEGGGENERFISYGPEDTERVERFTKAGFKMKRVPGILYHLDHYRGPNSLTMHKYFKNNEKEFEKIKAMNQDQIKEYINQLKKEQLKNA